MDIHSVETNCSFDISRTSPAQHSMKCTHFKLINVLPYNPSIRIQCATLLADIPRSIHENLCVQNSYPQVPCSLLRGSTNGLPFQFNIRLYETDGMTEHTVSQNNIIPVDYYAVMPLSFSCIPFFWISWT